MTFFHVSIFYITNKYCTKKNSNKELPNEIQSIFVKHLMAIESSFRNYFPSSDSGSNWIKDPFNMAVTNAKHLSILEQDILVELLCDTSLKLQFNKTELTIFWLLLRSDYPALANKALQHLIPFCATYLCEQAFSVLLYMKSKYRNKLNVEADLRIKISNIEPDIAILVSRKQLHLSH
ncbi:SCAN domain-containing protein 3 [Anthophora quadrimaculata]